jgi:predicted nucleotidyltransferase
MATSSKKSKAPHLNRWYRGADVPASVIRRFARDVVERFRPEKIVLFGSYAYGKPHADSDVDILVVMPARNQIDQAARISQSICPPFPLDIIVRTPKNVRWRLEEGNSFLKEVVTRGKVLYEKAGRRVGAKSRSRSGLRRGVRKEPHPAS